MQPDSEAQRLLINAVRASPDGQANLSVALRLRPKHRIVFQGVEHDVREVTVNVHAVAATADLHLRQFQLSSQDGPMKLVSELEATVAGKRIKIVLPDGGESTRICLQVDKADTGADATA